MLNWGLAALFLSGGTAVHAEGGPAEESGIDLSLEYTLDSVAVLRGGADRALRTLDNLDLLLDADLDRLLGWRGATAHIDVLNNAGAWPNASAGTLQGVDNIEAPRDRLRLYEAWVEQKMADDRVSLRVGLYDINSEFYATDTSAPLLGPPYGIGTELAATGVSGPSIFPMTSLAARLDVAVGKAGYMRAAVVGGRSGALTERGVADFTFPDGVLFIAEGGITAPVRLSLGAWAYSRKVDDLMETDAAGDPVQHRSHGGYVLAEVPLGGGKDGTRVTGFVRGGLSDSHTTPFRGGWQAGLHMSDLFGEDRGEAAIGVSQALVTGHFRDLLSADGGDPADSETQFEATLTMPVTHFLVVQPDVQLILNPGGVRNAPATVVAGLRLSVSL